MAKSLSSQSQGRTSSAAESTRPTSSQSQDLQTMTEAATRPQLRRLKPLNPNDIPFENDDAMNGPHPIDLNSFSVSWWARGEFVVRGKTKSEGGPSSSEKPSDKGADDSASDSLQSLVDRVANMDLNERNGKMTDYFDRPNSGKHRQVGFRATHVKKTHTKQATQSVKTSKITDFFPKRPAIGKKDSTAFFAILKLLQHTLHLMTGGTKGLDFFIPQWARPSRDWCKGDDSLDAELTDVDDPSWGVLRVDLSDSDADSNDNIDFDEHRDDRRSEDGDHDQPPDGGAAAADQLDADDGGVRMPKPMKKSEFYKAYKSKGSHQMYCDIMNDPSLRASAELLTRITKPLHKRYQFDLKTNQKGLKEILEWNAQRSLGSSFAVVRDIMKVTVSPDLCKVMRMSPPCLPPIPPDATVLDEDFLLIGKVFRFGVHLAGNFAWSEMLHRLTLPLAANSLLAENELDKKRGMRRLKKMVEAIFKAENLIEERLELGGCLKDLAFQEETFAREVMINLKRGGYKLGQPATTQVTKAMTKFSGGSSSTKEILESTFGHLAHVVAKNSTNKSMAMTNLWFYLTTSSFVKASGMMQNLPSPQDWVKWVSRYGLQSGLQDDSMYKRYNSAFQGSKTAIPRAEDIQIPRNAQGVAKTEWRLSGPMSHYKSSAAMAYLLHDQDSDFQHCVFFLRGQIFWDSSSDDYFLSLGFHGWCALGVHLRKVVLRKEHAELQEQSLAEVEALRVRSDMLETDLKTCKPPPPSETLADAEPLALQDLAPADWREALEVVDKARLFRSAMDERELPALANYLQREISCLKSRRDYPRCAAARQMRGRILDACHGPLFREP
eukprot:s756_g13.t1